MLAALASADRGRALSDEIFGEGYLTLLTTMAWACLLALAVLEEPLAGDGNFWTTRPHRWPSLLGAKVLFAALALHLPSFLADMLVLAGRGFSPAASFGPLLWKQILLFGAVTLPSMAFASLVRNFTHFVILVFAIATGVLILNGGFGILFRRFATQHYEVRQAVVRMLIAVAAFAVIWIQYAQRRIVPARIIAVAGALAAASLFALLPIRAEYAVPGTGFQEPPHISLRNAPLDAVVRNGVGNSQAVALPIVIAPGARTDRFHISTVEVEVETPGGAVFQSASMFRFPFPRVPDVYASVFFASNDSPQGWLWLRFYGAAWERVKNARVHIRGAATFEFYRPGQTTTIPAHGRHSVPDLGWCTSVPQEDQFSGTTTSLKLVCESLRDRPAASITLRHEASGWKRRVDLDRPVQYKSGLHGNWFSPLHLGEYYFQILTDANRSYPGAAGFMIPEAYVASARFEITPEIPTGHALARFDLGEVTLAPWLLSR
jgi:hypothetical protein